jgi:GntR family transcriptional regulator/MocR family aminotransferase
MRRIYAARRDALAAALRAELAGTVEFQVPPGGMALWCRVEEGVDLGRWAEASAAAGVPFDTGSQFSFDGSPVQALRLGFAAEAEKELREGVRRIAAARPRDAGGRRGRAPPRPDAPRARGPPPRSRPPSP